MSDGRAAAPAIAVAGLSKVYGGGLRRRRQVALDGLDLRVEHGGRVHGFLGPNGSGKTTTLRVLLGLVRADSGSAQMLGAAVPRELPRIVDQVGALVESPQFFRNFSGRRNLRYLAVVIGVAPARVDEMLDVVDLTDRADDTVKGYSLGMRQRLAIAAAMLKRPRVLLLDEPSNGLDPAGIRDVRALVRRLADDGITVLLSSHLLSEVQQVCDEVTIVARGRTIRSGDVADVLAAADSRGGRVRVRVDDHAAAAAVLAAAGMTAVRDGTHLVVSGVSRPAEVTRLLAEHGLYLSELVPDTVDLEEAFLLLTGDGAEHVDGSRSRPDVVA
jgi:ABC-2 type transport system ATP-binding protein